VEVRNIRLSKSVIGQEEIDAVTEVLRDEYLGMGKYVQKFETELSGFFRRDATLVNTGTAALHLALQCAGIGGGDEVLVQSLTYVACFQAIQSTGAKPIACEVVPETLTIDIEDAAQKLNSRTKAIMPVHYAGNVGDLDGIYKFAQKYGLRVIEDASHAFGTVYKGKLIGSFGDICCFSFDGIKNITSGEGGVIITSDSKVQKLLKDARLLSVENDTESRFRGTRTWDFDVKYQGWRYHMSNIMAAIGSAQLAKFPAFKEKRQSLAKLYQKELGGHVILIECNYDEVVPHIMVIMTDPVKRDHLKMLLKENGISTGMHYKPNHLLTLFCGNQDNSTLKKTESVYGQLITLPLHPDLSEDDAMFICGIIKGAL
jgi:dTDP-4-amino-4,6-dideoxygalactose transaminase